MRCHSMTERRSSSTRGVWVITTMPSAACVLHAIVGRGAFSRSTMQRRHAPAIGRPGW
jgi:hypothetical protein